MNYPYHCYHCDIRANIEGKAFHPPAAPNCPKCRLVMDRVFGCQIDTSGCKDHDNIPADKQVVRGAYGPSNPAAEERKFQRQIETERKMAREGGNNGTWRKTHSIPADLYHGKIRETGDKKYWEDPKNLKRHKSVEI